MMNRPGSPVPQAELIVGARRWSLDPTTAIVLGRDGRCDVRLDHAQVSRRHAEVSWHPDLGWVIHDLGSANGLYLSGQRVQHARLEPSAVVSLGLAADAPTVRVAAPPQPPPTPYLPPTRSGAPGPAFLAPAWAAPHLPEPRQGTVVVADQQVRAPVTIGRATDNTVVVDDLLVSRYHARATPEGDGFRVEDLGSLNGTYVNGAAVVSAHVGPWDLLTVGGLELRVVAGELQMAPQRTEVSLVARDLQVVLPQGKVLLAGVSFDVPEASLLAVIGPSGAGKSTLLNALTGARKATGGEVLFDGRDLYENYDELRHRIGLVPQDDVVHRQLTVRQALSYASELRFPADLDRGARQARIDEVVDELELRQHVDTRIDKLSGGQRKRTSVTLELLSRPSLLFLDEPTSGLDPALDRSVMRTLRGLADGGRTVVVITHNVANLNLCDRVLLLAPGGRVAYYGPPEGLLAHFGAPDYPDVFSYVTERPEESAARFSAYSQATGALRSVDQVRAAEPAAKPRRRQPVHRQASTLFRRHLRVLVADRSYAMFMGLLPLVLAALVMTVPGDAGFGPPARPPTSEPLQLLVVLIVGAAFMGMAASSRDLVGERAIYRREKSVGLSPTAYLGAKLVVFGLLAVVQSLLLVGVVLLVKEAPDEASLLGWSWVELVIAVAVTTFASATLGLVISAAVSTSEQVMPLLVVSIMAQLVLCGGLIPIAGRAGLEQLSWVAPSRWGFAAGASTVEVLAKVPTQTDELWRHTGGQWLFALLVLGLLAVVAVTSTGVLLRRVGTDR